MRDITQVEGVAADGQACIDSMWRYFCYGDCYVRVQASIAEAVVRWNCLPDKMNPVVRPLMDALRREENAELQVGCFRCWQFNSRFLNKQL